MVDEAKPALPAVIEPRRTAEKAPKKRWAISPLTLRILAVNMIALVLLGIGALFLDRYQEELISSEFQALDVQAGLIAGAIGEGATALDDNGDAHLEPQQARALVRRMAVPVRSRVQLFGEDGQAIIDSSLVALPGGEITVVPLPDLDRSNIGGPLGKLYDWIFNALPRRDSFPPYRPRLVRNAYQDPLGAVAMRGDSASAAYLAQDGHLVFAVGVPVQRFRVVQGAVILSRTSQDVDDALRRTRSEIVLVFLGALAVTIFLSLYLAGTIARPIRLLADAAEHVRLGRAPTRIPDFGHRHDEIGELSVALRAMTEALWQRLEAIESFAADVAHEIKNPLSSLRSAVETAARVQDPEQQRRLMAIIQDDVRRLDRLISDIAASSRLDAELARAAPAPTDLARLLQALVEVHKATSTSEDTPQLVLELPPGGSVVVPGIEDRLVQVFRNLIANAVSFSPPGGIIRLLLLRRGDRVLVTVEDSGPGSPEGKAEAIFQRFYSERPQSEQFGIHSGLGLSISRQIVEAHGGTIRAENRLDAEGKVIGARFIVILPLRREGDAR